MSKPRRSTKKSYIEDIIEAENDEGEEEDSELIAAGCGFRWNQWWRSSGSWAYAKDNYGSGLQGWVDSRRRRRWGRKVFIVRNRSIDAGYAMICMKYANLCIIRFLHILCAIYEYKIWIRTYSVCLYAYKICSKFTTYKICDLYASNMYSCI